MTTPSTSTAAFPTSTLGEAPLVSPPSARPAAAANRRTSESRTQTCQKAFETLLEAAIWAPSGDNTQPWRFEVDEGAQTITVHVDPARDPSPMNAGQRMSRIAVGAAVENLVQTAEHNGWQSRVEVLNVEPGSVRVAFAGLVDQVGEVPPVILRRSTNRKLYDGQPLAPDQLARLQSLRAPEGITFEWITDRQALEQAAVEIGEADAAMFSIPAVRQAFLDNIRFDRPANEAVTEGLSLGSLEISALESYGLRALGQLPDSLFRLLGLRRIFRSKAQQLVRSASGLCLIHADQENPATDIAVGRALQSAWLALTELHLAAQPMMSLPVLKNMANGIVNLSAQHETAKLSPSAILRVGTTNSIPSRVARKVR